VVNGHPFQSGRGSRLPPKAHGNRAARARQGSFGETAPGVETQPLWSPTATEVSGEATETGSGSDASGSGLGSPLLLAAGGAAGAGWS